ncbi:hypothetical protein L246_23045 [Salmonella enterica subsp. enterica serovar Worthington str. BCH-5715]|nr:hypothetical protein L246_23045 [Salmonella enterica subsp. enterica serovar Worthington str. BCH-5715]
MSLMQMAKTSAALAKLAETPPIVGSVNTEM